VKRLWDDDELATEWTLEPSDQTLLANKTGATRLGFAALLTFFRHSGHFLPVKGPLVVRPVFLHSNRRAAALISVCAIAVMVYGLVEAEVRRAIAPRRTIPGLLPEGRAARPTAPNIFAIFFAGHGFQRVRSRDGLIEVPDPLSPAQKHVFAALGIASSLPPQGSLRP
jgi:hypothetical protein